MQKISNEPEPHIAKAQAASSAQSAPRSPLILESSSDLAQEFNLNGSLPIFFALSDRAAHRRLAAVGARPRGVKLL